MSQTVGELVYKISADTDGLQASLKKTEGQMGDLKKSVENTDKTTSKFSSTMSNLAKGLGLAYLAKLVVDFGKKSVQAFANAQQSLIQYNNAEQNVAGTTKEQINNLNDYINALEQRTTVDDKSIRQGAQILAQDQIKIENQKKLLAGIVDLAVANSKSNGGEVDVAGTAKAIGRVVSTGDAGILTRQNVVVDPKTAKALKETADEAQRTALVMKVLEDNAKGAGDALGNSLQGRLNRAKDSVEDLQVAVGKGLTAAFSVFTAGLGDTVGGIKVADDGANKLGTAFVYLAGLLNFVINTFKLAGLGIYQLGIGFVGLAKVILGFGKDTLGVFKQVGVAINSLAEGLGDVLTGKFKKAKEAIKNGFDFSGTFDNTKKALAETSAASDKVSASFVQTSKDLKANIMTMADAKNVYGQVSAEQDKLTTATNAAAEAKLHDQQMTDSQIEANKNATAALEKFRGQLLGVIDDSAKVRAALEEDLTKSMNKFSEDVSGNIKDTTTGLADIVVGAQEKIKELKAEQSASDDADRQEELQKEIKQQQAILASREGFEQRQADRIQAIRDKLSAAGIDSTKIEGLTQEQTLTEAIAEKQRLDALNAFQLFEEQQSLKLERITTDFLTEVSLTQAKVEKQKEYEQDLTDFLVQTNKVRNAEIDAWAANTIAKHKAVADSLRALISLQGQLQSATTKKQFHKGGMVGADGGEVHAGEYVIPSNLVSKFGSVVSAIESARRGGITNNNKTVNAPISINAQVQDGLDFRAISREMAWELGGK